MARLRFGVLEVDSGAGQLLRRGQPVALAPMPFRLLVHLAVNARRVVSADEILLEVWSGVHVTRSSIYQAVHTLRTALGPEGALVRSVRGSGYRLDAEVERSGGEVRSEGLVGRQALLERFEVALEGARRGEGRLVLLTGEPGIGKSRLLSELARHCQARGGRASVSLPGDAPPTLAALRARLATAQERPILLAFDDLHRADVATWLQLETIARHGEHLPVLLVASFRDGPACLARDAAAAVAQLLRLARTTSERLPRLAQDEVGALADAASPRGLVADSATALYERSGGNPYLVHTLLRAARRTERPVARVTLDNAQVRQAVAAHLEIVDPRVRGWLHAAAVLGSPFDPALLAEALGEPRCLADDALRSAREAEILDEGPAPRQLRFAHGLLREALYDEIEASVRFRLHARVAEALERRAQLGAPRDEALTRHAARGAAELGTARASALCATAARDATRRLAFAEAARSYQRAFELSEQSGGDAHASLELLLAQGEALSRAGESARAAVVLEGALGRTRAAGDAALRVRAVLALRHVRLDDTALPDTALAALLEKEGERLGIRAG